MKELFSNHTGAFIFAGVVVIMFFKFMNRTTTGTWSFKL